MFAVQYFEYGPPEVLTIGEAAEPHAGPGQVRITVRAAGVTPADWYLRSGAVHEMAPLTFPHIPGMDAAGVVDELGPGVTGVAIGDAVFGLTPSAGIGGATAEFAVLEAWATKPDAFTWEQAGGAAGNIETATRVLDKLGVTSGSTLLIEGAAGGVGTVTTQLAVARGATVIGTAREPGHALLRRLGAIPTSYGPGLAERVAELAPSGVDRVLDAAGSGSLPDLIAIAGDPSRVVTVADLNAAEHGVHLSHTGPSDPTGNGTAGLAVAAALAARGRFTIPVAATFPLEEAARAHALSATRRAHGKIVLTIP